MDQPQSTTQFKAILQEAQTKHCILSYLSVWILFSLIYWVEHRQNPRSFQFMSELTENLASERIEVLNQELAQLQEKNKMSEDILKAADHLLAAWSGRTGQIPHGTPLASGGFSVTEGEYTMEADFHSNQHNGKMLTLRYAIFKQGSFLGNIGPAWITLKSLRRQWTYEHFRAVLEKGRPGPLSAEIQDLKIEKDNLDTTPEKAWGFPEFLYFSTIVQATIGFGDIVPNSRLVRMTVVLQSVLGIGISVFWFASLLARTSAVGSPSSRTDKANE